MRELSVNNLWRWQLWSCRQPFDITKKTEPCPKNGACCGGDEGDATSISVRSPGTAPTEAQIGSHKEAQESQKSLIWSANLLRFLRLLAANSAVLSRGRIPRATLYSRGLAGRHDGWVGYAHPGFHSPAARPTAGLESGSHSGCGRFRRLNRSLILNSIVELIRVWRLLALGRLIEATRAPLMAEEHWAVRDRVRS